MIQNQDAGEQRLQELNRQMSAIRKELEHARKQLQKVRESIFERMAEQLPQYSEI